MGKRSGGGGGHAAIGLSKVTPGKSWHHICSRATAPSLPPSGSTRLPPCPRCPPRCLAGRDGRGASWCTKREAGEERGASKVVTMSADENITFDDSANPQCQHLCSSSFCGWRVWGRSNSKNTPSLIDSGCLKQKTNNLQVQGKVL